MVSHSGSTPKAPDVTSRRTFVNEQRPKELTEFLRDEEKVPNYKIPSGRLYFTGVEYGFKDDDSFLKKCPHMGGAIHLESELYSFSVFRAEYPDGVKINCADTFLRLCTVFTSR